MRKTALILAAANLLLAIINIPLGNYTEASFAFAAAVTLSNFL